MMPSLQPKASDTPPRPAGRPSSPVWPLILGAVVFAIVATGLTMYFQIRPAPLPVLFDAPTFEMTDQTGRTLSSQQLRGNVWVACFIFTHCAGPCPKMTEALVRTSQAIDSRRMRFVAFSVDPDRDTPPVLQQYARKFDADPVRTHLLTRPGTDPFEIARGFRVAAGSGDGEHTIFHSEKFFLVDPAGRVRGIYSHREDPDMSQLVADAGRLLGE
ncbi:MAG: SCO family protein [Phycisphaerales bacterium]|nr:SCO family protein [Phycisphaerales bacterium]